MAPVCVGLGFHRLSLLLDLLDARASGNLGGPMKCEDPMAGYLDSRLVVVKESERYLLWTCAELLQRIGKALDDRGDVGQFRKEIGELVSTVLENANQEGQSKV
jgi:hypothetical protein